MKKEKRTILFLLFVTVLGIVGRVFLWDIESSDMGVYLKWYARAEEYGGLPGLYAIGQKIKGYNALFQLLVAVLTHIPGEAIYKLKATWLIFDILLAAGAGRLVFENLNADKEKRMEYGALMHFCAAYEIICAFRRVCRFIPTNKPNRMQKENAYQKT